MLDTVYGQTQNREVARNLNDILNGMNLTGSLYIGYPVIATADEKVTVDALLVSYERGVVVFTFCQIAPPTENIHAWKEIRDGQDRLYVAVENNLRRHDTLRVGRGLAVNINIVTLFPTNPHPPEEVAGCILSDLPNLRDILQKIPAMDIRFFRPLQAALQHVTTIKPKKKRETATRPDSRGAFLKRIELGIANLDQWQKRAAIESPEGPQRIRGLAGSGKTIVLALKAAYLHIQHPDWIIAVTFFTRSLYQQYEDLIRRFSFEYQGDEPNWDNLRIRHAWGGSDRGGIYTEIALDSGLPPRDYLYARSQYGMRDAFDGICNEILSTTSEIVPNPIYDAVLIDEAQDMPSSFFRMVYRFTRPPKRIVWAYDELQKLSEAGMPTLEELFGQGRDGQPAVYLTNSPEEAQQDITLPVCYRNPPWTLTVAHGLGFGTQRPEGLIQHFDDPNMWTEIGYHVLSGELQEGRNVTLERSPTSYPDYFQELLNSEDTVISHAFENGQQQAEWVAQSILDNLQTDQLEHDDILIILPSAYTAKKDAKIVMDALTRHGINSHLAGVTSSRDQIFIRNSIALANIYRSKGNEAAMVYVLNAQQCVSGPELITLRNTLFTAITRSRAWVRICGYGSGIQQLRQEIEIISRSQYRLAFRIPTSPELAKIRQIHRELSADERSRMQKATVGLQSFVEALDRGDIVIENLPFELRSAIAKYFNNQANANEDTERDSDGTS